MWWWRLVNLVLDEICGELLESRLGGLGLIVGVVVVTWLYFEDSETTGADRAETE